MYKMDVSTSDLFQSNDMITLAKTWFGTSNYSYLNFKGNKNEIIKNTEINPPPNLKFILKIQTFMNRNKFSLILINIIIANCHVF